MKRIANVVLSLWFAVCAAYVFAACQGGGVASAEVLESTESALVIYVKETDGNATLYDVMKELRKDGKMEFKSESSSYGQSLKSINGVENAADWSWYWASYTTDENNGTDVIEIDGERWYYSAAGISYLKVKKGERYMFRYIELS